MTIYEQMRARKTERYEVEQRRKKQCRKKQKHDYYRAKVEQRRIKMVTPERSWGYL